ncbi:hypothetical protein [Nodularia spumigena]|uniref:hypothetical protein n=1 Tax=Nodularia spumigena TaxID=70799 RepID=UPI0030DA20B0
MLNTKLKSQGKRIAIIGEPGAGKTTLLQQIADYAFFHASFQEYFAAIVIDDWHFFLNHVPKNPSQGTYRIFESQWKQRILLWLGREEEKLKQQKQKFIDALVNFKDGCQKCYEYRAYFLAAAGIAEFRDYSKADEIVAQILNLTINGLSSIQEKVRSALQQTDRTKAIAALVELLQSPTVDDDTRWQAAESLGKILQNSKKRLEVVKILSSYWRLDNESHNLAWKCSHNMRYADFYQAWHQHNVATRAMRSLKKILFTRII